MAQQSVRSPAVSLAAEASPATRTAPQTASNAPTSEVPASNSEVLSLVTDTRVDERPASLLLDLSLAGTGGDTDWAAPLPEEAPQPAAPAGRRPDGTLGSVWDSNNVDVARMNLTLSRAQKVELDIFRDKYEANQEKYEEVARRTGVPAMLVAAIHYRESSMNFGTYLHQGDPLGKKAVHVPNDIPVFSDWTEAAIHALNSKKSIADAVGLTADSRDGTAMATYAEAYNGLGYHNRGLASPYVFAGSDRYTGGMYVSDGKFSGAAFDRRLGVATILQGMGALDPTKEVARGTGGGKSWQDVMAGDHLVRQNQRGDAVTAMQERLVAAGYAVEVDGAYGPKTAEAVRRFQKEHGLEVDGVIGVGTAAALQKGVGAAKAETAPGATPTPPAPAPTPTPAPAKTLDATPRDQAWEKVGQGAVLEKGSKGEAVRALQERLRARGYAIAIDGDFGPATRAAVYNLQAELGLRVDGGVGPQTAAALDAALGRK